MSTDQSCLLDSSRLGKVQTHSNLLVIPFPTLTFSRLSLFIHFAPPSHYLTHSLELVPVSSPPNFGLLKLLRTRPAEHVCQGPLVSWNYIYIYPSGRVVKAGFFRLEQRGVCLGRS